MPKKCHGVKCSQQRNKENGIQLNGFPGDPNGRNLWAKSIKRIHYDIVNEYVVANAL